MTPRPAVMLLAILVCANRQAIQQPTSDDIRNEKEVNTLLMLSTLVIESVPPGKSLGTVYIIGRPMDHPPAEHPDRPAYVLITADHVLQVMPGDDAALN